MAESAQPGVTHVLMTRFNLATPGRELAIRTQPGWLEGRFELFERHCLPSVAAQTARGFRWIIFFDEGTPAEFRARIAGAQAIQPFEAYFTGLFPGEGWARAVNEVIAPRTPWLLTTRLDNDDALASDFTARLHAAVAGTGLRRGTYNFTNGLVVGAGRAYAHAHDSNPFASWLEPWDEKMRTAPSIHHMTWADQGPVTQIGGPPAWAQVIHGGNVSNTFRGLRIAPAAAEARFAPGTLGKLVPAGRGALMADRLLAAPLRRLRDLAGDLLRMIRGRGAAR